MQKPIRRSPRAAGKLVCAVVEALESRQLLSGTLRIVNYNIDADTTDFTNQSAPLEAVLEAIGDSHLNDNGVMNAQPIDVLAVEELQNGAGTANAPTLASIVAALNATYGAGTYAYDTTTDPTDSNGTLGNGPNGLIYNTHTIQDLGATPLGTPSGSGEARAPMQYKLQPVGYTSAADFYVDVSHMKSGTGATNAGRRAIEAATIINSLTALGANAHVIALGDFNITGDSSEQTYKTMRIKFDDPANPAGNWTSSASFPNLLSESATDDEFRDDIQFVTPAADSSSTSPGLQLSQGSLEVFGNGGASSIYKKAVANTTANPGVFPDFTPTFRTTVLNDLETDTDHLPVVADYSIVGLTAPASPQIGSLSVSPASAVTGSTVTLTAANVTETGGTIASVAFYLESNGSSGLQIGSDTLLGTGVQSGSTWTFSTTAALPAGAYTYYAVATDASNVNSSPASATLTVTAIPPYITISNGSVYTWNSTTGELDLSSGTVTFTEDQASSGDTTDPLVNLIATGTGSTVVFNTDQHIAALTLSGGATASILSGAQAIVNTTALTINPGSTFDITNNSLTINFASPSVDPVAVIAGYLAAGYNGGAWTGLGLISSTAAASPGKFSVGYADGNNDSGTGTPANEIRIKYTIAGNASLDGSVGFDDLVSLAQNFGDTGKDWSQGNFTYDPSGSVGFSDLVLLAQNFGDIGGASVTPPTGLAPVTPQAVPVQTPPAAAAAPSAASLDSDTIDTLLGTAASRKLL